MDAGLQLLQLLLLNFSLFRLLLLFQLFSLGFCFQVALELLDLFAVEVLELLLGLFNVFLLLGLLL